jgi:hypothetical protein
VKGDRHNPLDEPISGAGPVCICWVVRTESMRVMTVHRALGHCHE